MVICHVMTSPVHLDCFTRYLHLALSSQLLKGLRGLDCTVQVVVAAAGIEGKVWGVCSNIASKIHWSESSFGVALICTSCLICGLLCEV